ncbi:MAG: thermonuclease family protein [Saprospiraceae bacterium]
MIIRDVNLIVHIVQAGLAWHFKKPSDDARYDRLQQIARQKRIGLWIQPNPLEPWNWRKQKKESSKQCKGN